MCTALSEDVMQLIQSNLSVDEGDINLTNLTWLTAFVLHPRFDIFVEVSIKCVCNYIKNIFDMKQDLQEINLISKMSIVLCYFHDLSKTQENFW